MRAMYAVAVFAVLCAAALVSTISAEPNQAEAHVEETNVILFLIFYNFL